MVPATLSGTIDEGVGVDVMAHLLTWSKRAWWSSYARVYDRLWSGPLSATLARTVVDLAGSPRGLAVDVGAGTGLVSGALVAAGHRLVCVDASSVMLRRLRQRVPSASVVVGSLPRLPLRPESADLVVATNVLHLSTDPATELSALATLVTAGGTLICSWPLPAASPGLIARRERELSVSTPVIAARYAGRWLVAITAALFTRLRRASGHRLESAVRQVADAFDLAVQRVELADAAQAVIVLRPVTR
jgi:SAM-dependent methyltransferase